MGQFDSKVAVVTGGSQGLGAAIAALFVERGARGIVICGRSREKGEAKAAGLGEAGSAEVRFVQADLSRVEDCQAVIASADRHFGRVDVLVNAAAMTDRGTNEKATGIISLEYRPTKDLHFYLDSLYSSGIGAYSRTDMNFVVRNSGNIPLNYKIDRHWSLESGYECDLGRSANRNFDGRDYDRHLLWFGGRYDF